VYFDSGRLFLCSNIIEYREYLLGVISEREYRELGFFLFVIQLPQSKRFRIRVRARVKGKG
jgi:hypothetical protein